MDPITCVDSFIWVNNVNNVFCMEAFECVNHVRAGNIWQVGANNSMEQRDFVPLQGKTLEWYVLHITERSLENRLPREAVEMVLFKTFKIGQEEIYCNDQSCAGI